MRITIDTPARFFHYKHSISNGGPMDDTTSLFTVLFVALLMLFFIGFCFVSLYLGLTRGYVHIPQGYFGRRTKPCYREKQPIIYWLMIFLYGFMCSNFLYFAVTELLSPLT